MPGTPSKQIVGFCSANRAAPLARCLLVSLLLTVPLAAQHKTRAEEIRAARKDKAARLEPEVAYKIEERLNKLDRERVIERLMGADGLGVRLGGMPTGQGFALGPQYRRRDLADGNVVFRTSLAGTLSKAWLADLQVTMPKLANGKLTFDFHALHRNSPRFEYFGPGPDSKEGNRTNYRIEENSYDFTVGLRPFRPFAFGVTGGLYEPNTGPGNRSGIAQIGDVFMPGTIPGLMEQTDFLRGGFFVQFDNRDIPGTPRKGGHYAARFVYYDDRDLKRHSHRRLDLDAQHYIPFFNRKRVIALRAKTIMTFANGSAVVPFYMQPVLGGSDDLRGFRQWRFYDNNLIVATAEYRWEAFSGLDMALFFDAGKVTPKRSEVNFHDLEGSAGFGLRFNAVNSVFIRIDVGFSHEGTQIWLKFGNVF